MTTAERRCELCDLPADDVRDDAGHAFCCEGCRHVFETLDAVDQVDADDVREQAEADDAPDIPEEHEATFLEVDGMYCTSCEAFIEAAATDLDGVSAASASYVTETVRIDHDPAIETSALREALSGLGYTAYPREDAMSRRAADNWAFARLAIGVLVGMMVMLQYVLILYPTFFDGLFYDDRTAQFLADMLAASGARYFFIALGVMTTIVLFVTGKPILRGAYVSIRTRTPNMDLLVALAAVSAYVFSWITVATGGIHVYFDVTVAIIVIVTVGNHHESAVKREATDRLADLTSIQVDRARRVTDGEHEDVAVSELGEGDRVLVRAGERIPVDGRIVEGEGAADEAVVTGEALPVHKTPGDRVIGGAVITDGAVVVAVDANPTSSLDRIANLVWDLQSTSGGIQRLADKLATVFVPLVLVVALVVAVAYLGLGTSIGAALLVGLTVLIVSCPCALGLATPLAIASGVREALDRNIVIFDETVFERLRGADTVIFDKTGTLTTGDFTVRDAEAPAGLLGEAAALESRSSHPVARAIADAFEVATDGGTVEKEPAIDAFESRAHGVVGTVAGTRIAVGHPDLFAELGWPVPEHVEATVEAIRKAGDLPIVVGRAGRAEGAVAVGDTPRDGWEETVEELARRGMSVVVLTGDDRRRAAPFRDHPSIAEVFAGVPPEAKAETVARLAAEGRTVMVGDGTNDAPALARSDLGISMGGGTAMAVDAADIAIVDDDLRSVGTVFDLASAAGRRVKENIGWAFCYNAIAIPVAIAGLLNPLFAAGAMATSSVLVVTNSSRSLLAD